ncbi:MAG: LEA type 2 family protein [Myxococcales bacterium]
MPARSPRALPAAAAALFVLAAAPACFGPKRQVLSRAEEPSAAIEQLSARSFDRQHADLQLDLVLDNPGAELSLASADYELLAEGRSFAVGTSKLEVRVPAGGQARLSLSLKLAYLDLPYAARNRVRAGQTVQLVARGTLRGRAGAALLVAIPFDGEAIVGLTVGPEGP